MPCVTLLYYVEDLHKVLQCNTDLCRVNVWFRSIKNADWIKCTDSPDLFIHCTNWTFELCMARLL